ncbi:hypothetical protein Tco_0838264 [Tanacetum coccineum]|uniref:Uncharacterized protein n=1 Tax=Tanacetum coccineum TaxID=301880 RepID=A0ABQ5AQ77_9ASTR
MFGDPGLPIVELKRRTRSRREIPRILDLGVVNHLCLFLYRSEEFHSFITELIQVHSQLTLPMVTAVFRSSLYFLSPSRPCVLTQLADEQLLVLDHAYMEYTHMGCFVSGAKELIPQFVRLFVGDTAVESRWSDSYLSMTFVVSSFSVNTSKVELLKEARNPSEQSRLRIFISKGDIKGGLDPYHSALFMNKYDRNFSNAVTPRLTISFSVVVK